MARKEVTYKHIKIVDFADKGQAIGRSEAGEIFLIPGPVPGDVVSITVRRKKKGLKLGKVTEFEELSADRRIPFCDHFDLCGGCKWQHFDYYKQLEFKEKQVVETLQRIGGIPKNLANPIIPAEQTRYFRNKMEYTFSNKRWLTEQEIQSGEKFPDRNALGFHRPGHFDKVINIDRCFLQDEKANKIRNYVRWYCQENDFHFFDIKEKKGLLRNLTLRNTSLDEWMVLFSFYENDEAAIFDILEAVKQAFPDLASLCYVINPKANDTIYDLPIHLYSGSLFIKEKLGTVEYKIGPKSFFQTNPAQAEKLFSRLRTLVEMKPNETVYDLYSGIGSISLFIADVCRKVIGIETLEAAVEDAKENARWNKIENVSFHAGKVEELLNTEFMHQHGIPDLIIVDPPRAGLHKNVLEQIEKSGVSRLIYVSCNPSTQARDLKLIEESYSCTFYQPVDMFPHSHHVENIALLERKN
jgi:23S rRNA (uracil1939-C5)-methyltransferase